MFEQLREPTPRLAPAIPFGYVVDPLDSKNLIPHPVVIELLIEGLNSLENGLSLREVSEYITANIPEDYYKKSISPMGLLKFWRKVGRVRPPVHEGAVPKKKGKTRAEQKEINRRKKLGSERKKLHFLKKRMEKFSGEIEHFQEEAVIEKTIKKGGILEVDFTEDRTVPEQKVIFRPNAGPQTEFLASEEQEVLYGGAAGGGKSYAMLADPIRYFSNPSFNGLLLRRTNDELRELKWKSRELYDNPILKGTWREKDSLWRFPSGAQLWLTYLERDEDVMRYQGQSFTWIGIDELTQYATPFAWNFLRSRLRTVDPSLPELMRATSNPGGPGHGWVKRMFFDPSVPNEPFWATNIETTETLVYPPVYQPGHPQAGQPHPKAGQPLFQRKFIPARLYDNPYLTQTGSYEASLLSLPENQRRQLLEGDWTVADGAAFGEFREHIHTCKPFEIPSNWRRFRSCDFGYSTFSAVHWYAIDPENTLYVYRELYVSKKTGQDLARMIMDLERKEKVTYGVLDSSVWSQRGQAGPSIAEEMISMGCRWRPSDRTQGSRIAGKNRLHELLKVNEGTQKPGIIFFNTCRQIISDLPVIPSDPDGGEDINDKYASDHAYDSIRYGIMSRPRPSTWDIGHRFSSSYSPSDAGFGY